MLDISCKSSAVQTFCMKYQALFSMICMKYQALFSMIFRKYQALFSMIHMKYQALFSMICMKYQALFSMIFRKYQALFFMIHMKYQAIFSQENIIKKYFRISFATILTGALRIKILYCKANSDEDGWLSLSPGRQCALQQSALGLHCCL